MKIYINTRPVPISSESATSSEYDEVAESNKTETGQVLIFCFMTLNH